MKRVDKYLVRLFVTAILLVLGSFWILPASVKAQVVYDNSKLRFGTGFEASVNAIGNLQQPFYYNAVQKTWRKLTFSAYSLETAFAIGGNKTNEWNTNGTIVLNPALSNQVIDASGFVVTNGSRGYGTITSRGNILIDGKMLEIKNTYVLPKNNAYMKVTTSVKNVSASLLENVRIWTGTRDDWVGTTDWPVKNKGNLANGEFVPLTNASDRGTALQINTGAEGVLIYTHSPKGNSIIQGCCSFNNIIGQNPQTSQINRTSDGSYGFYVRLNDLAVGASDGFTWYYAAGELAQFPEIIVDVTAAIGGLSNIAYTSATFKATVAEPAAGYWMVVPRSATPPTAAQIRAGADYGTVGVIASGSAPMTANLEQTFLLSGLNHGTKWDLYFVSENTSSVFSALLKVPFATQAYIAPTLSTTVTTAVTPISAQSGGTITADGGTAVTSRGICWNTSAYPTIADNKTAEGIGTGSFSSSLTSLTPNTIYYVRSYATNAAGTTYGNQVIFKTNPADPVAVSLSADNICVGSPVQLTVQGAQGTVYWYTGGCGNTLVGIGNAIMVYPGATTTYYARNNNGSFSSGCASVAVTVNNDAPAVLGKDVTINLQADLKASVSATDIDNGSYDACGAVNLTISSGKTVYDCSDIGKTYPVVLTVTDQQGNSSSDTMQVTVADPQFYCNHAPVAVAKPLTVSADANCQGTAAAEAFNDGSTDADGDEMAFTVDPAGPYAVGTTQVTLKVTDPYGASSTSHTTITVIDDTFPVLAAIVPITLTADAGVCGAIVHYPTPVGIDHCAVTTVQTAGLASGALFPVGTTTNTFTATDASGNATTTSFTVTVADKEAPVAFAQNITVGLDETGMATITGAQVNSGSADNCGVASLVLDKTAFDCSHIGPNAVTLTVTDIHGNSSSATALVTVEDRVGPTVLTRNITVELRAGNQAVITADQINNGSTDACGIASVVADKTIFNCANLGANTVTLTVTDIHRNVSTGTALVTVKDVTPPVAKAKRFHIVSLKNGTASINADLLNDGSTDECRIASVTVSPAAFSCDNIGINTVTLTVTDGGGNVTTASTTVLVLGVTPVSSIRVIKCEHKHCTDSRCNHSRCQDHHCRDHHADHKHSEHDDDDDCENNKDHCGHKDHQYLLSHQGNCGYKSHLDDYHQRSCSSNPDGIAGSLDKKTIYLGYGEQKVILDATSGNDYSTTYAWTGNGELSSRTSGRPEFAPKLPGVYTFTVTKTNLFGCTASSSVTITVVDVRCGTANDMVSMCHKGQLICVAPGTVKAHLAHGDKIGICATGASSNARMVSVVDYARESGLTTYPNPVHRKTNIEFTMVEAGSYRLVLYDLKGALVKDIAAGQAESNGFFSYELDVRAYPVGIYLVRLTTDREIVTKRLIIEK